jgi:hypothetical protein
MICLRMARISDCISDSGLADAGALASHIQMGKTGLEWKEVHVCTESDGSTNLISNTQRSNGVRVSLDIMARTS